MCTRLVTKYSGRSLLAPLVPKLCMIFSLRPNTYMHLHPPLLPLPPTPLRNESHDKMKRYGHTLSIIHTLNLFFQENKLSGGIFMELFKHVMPLWMDLLLSLREEPGKIKLLQDHIRYAWMSRGCVMCDGVRDLVKSSCDYYTLIIIDYQK